MKHVLIFCHMHASIQHELKDEQEHVPDFLKLLGTGEGLQITSKWVMQRGILGHFRGGQGPALWPSSFPLLSTGLTLSWF